MLTGNTNFYHGHIQSNIARLQQRKDKFIHNRLEFVKQYCVPIETHIKQIYKEVDRYKTMKDTQEEVIENEPDIVSLKEEISNYMTTHHYFQQKLDQYEKKQIELDQYNRTIRARIHSMKNNIKNHREELGFRLPEISRSRTTTVNSEKSTFPLFKSFVQPQTSKQLEQYPQNKSEASFDKRMIRISSQMRRIQSHLISKQVQKNSDIIIEDELNEHPKQTKQAKKRIFSVRQKITAFNKTQTLFRDCFETKKRCIQKSVSQLQSKLIVHRSQFLNVCQAIGAKDKTVAFEQFNRLSCDEIVTLFISFVWLNQRLNSEFKQKRKDIMEHIGKLPKLA